MNSGGNGGSDREGSIQKGIISAKTTFWSKVTDRAQGTKTEQQVLRPVRPIKEVKDRYLSDVSSKEGVNKIKNDFWKKSVNSGKSIKERAGKWSNMDSEDQEEWTFRK